MWTQRFIDTKRGRFELFEKGQGEPLAITHLYTAFDQRGNAFASPFTEKYRVYLVNLSNAGNSVKVDDSSRFSMDESVLDLEAIREALGIKKWGFAGHSTGGMLALKYAINNPDSLTKVIAGGAAASFEYGKHPGSVYCRKNKNFNRIVEIMNLLDNSSTPKEVRKQISYEWSLMSFYSEEKLKESLKKETSGKTVGERLTYFRKIEYSVFDVRESLKKVTLPCYVYSGKYDSQCPLLFGLEIARLLPNAKFSIFEKSNHYPFFEEEEKFQDFVYNT